MTELRNLEADLWRFRLRVAVAGEFGTRLCQAALETPGVGEVFAAGVRAIEDKDTQGLARLLELSR